MNAIQQNLLFDLIQHSTLENINETTKFIRIKISQDVALLSHSENPPSGDEVDFLVLLFLDHSFF